MALFKRVIELPGLQRIEITDTQFTVTRLTSEGEAVFPEPGEDTEADITFILSSIQQKLGLDELEFDPERHPHMSWLLAAQKIMDARLRPTYVIAPEGEWLGAFVGLPEGTIPASCFGMKVIYTDHEAVKSKIVLLGGTTNLLADVVYGVAVDMGD